IAVGLTVIMITVPVTIFLLRKNPAEKNLLPYGEEEVAEVTETDAEPIKKSGIDFQVARKSDRKSTRLNSSHVSISYAVFCLKKKTEINVRRELLRNKIVRE